MSAKKKTYSADFKAKVVLELLSNASTLNQVASKYDVTPQSILTWKKQFLENASLAFDVSGATKAYKDEIEELKESNDKLAKALGNTTIERDWAVGKLKSLDLLSKKSLIDSQAQDLSLSCSKAEFRSKARTKQCKLLKVSRSSLYYKPKPMSEINHSILNAMDEIYTDNPEYGYRYIH
ncbi:MAG TPA: transposase, partial [Campylobacterales bacterium]|nr:transposase [Campylobacterales bacterium]